MGGNPVKEPTVVGNNHGTATKLLQGFFKRPHRIDVEIVGWFVKEQYVGATFKDLG
jgi:hypothetical protein